MQIITTQTLIRCGHMHQCQMWLGILCWTVLFYVVYRNDKKSMNMIMAQLQLLTDELKSSQSDSLLGFRTAVPSCRWWCWHRSVRWCERLHAVSQHPPHHPLKHLKREHALPSALTRNNKTDLIISWLGIWFQQPPDPDLKLTKDPQASTWINKAPTVNVVSLSRPLGDERSCGDTKTLQ